ncbi:MAG: DoxX family membrane protein [Candidatus Parvarchaeota archaeon]|nr:DoxX family membrane protein [Candidatus Parvarchaeota archaeon]MCW1294618.1 DoxX family membrane protein [Candidatus Parvarchaeum tengchongense]MCW1295218.1 DoxX family membrane protein [Candidatus Parvarchaeum tengchongense]MCW1299418.1 DoxX family membrane protein [Candidatus Parvarchaeum tengchongense]MCW1312261.1 DoxX family membrane protein [Candidatus Parvarchaeum tengchongense]
MEKVNLRFGKIPFITRVLLGVIFIADSMLKLIPDSAYLIKENVLSGAYGAWSFVYPWVSFWANVTANNINFFVYFAIIVEFLIGLFLILGFFKKFLYVAGAVYSIAIWLTISQFGGPYIAGTLDIGATPFYFLLFLLLIFSERNFNAYDISIDKSIKKKFNLWGRLAFFKKAKSKNEKTNVFAISSIAFGAIFAINASLKLVSGTASNIAGNQLMQILGEPKFLIPFFLFWDKLILPNIHLFLYMYAFSELAIALLLIFGLFRKGVYIAGIAYSLFSWSVIQGFGGPFFAGVTDLAAGPLYVLIFIMFMFYNSNSNLSAFYSKK